MSDPRTAEAPAWAGSLVTDPETGETFTWADAPWALRERISSYVADLAAADADATDAAARERAARERGDTARAHLRTMLVPDNPVMGVVREPHRLPQRKVDTVELDRCSEQLPDGARPHPDVCPTCTGTGQTMAYPGVRDLDRHKDQILRAGVAFDRLVTRPEPKPDAVRIIGGGEA